jgi:hypothetical protein
MRTQDEILEHITRTIVERFDPYRIVLFGSRATEAARVAATRRYAR